MAKVTTLKNKVRVITHPLPGTEAVTILILAGAGSRYETKDINGISHFLEHMFFKGGKTYQTAQEVAATIDNIGGEFNAFTGKEYAGYYVKVAAEHLETATKVLADMLLEATLQPEEINKERGVILEELNMYQDTPTYQIGWAFENLLFGDQPIGWDQIGTKELINTVTQQQFQQYLKELYTPDNIVIGICGKYDETTTTQLIESHFGSFIGTKQREYKKFTQPPKTNNVLVISKATEQAHLVIGTLGPAFDSEERWATRILTTILGGNMSSRMFSSVREEQGLAYYIHTSADMYSDIGVISTRAGVDTTRTPQAIEAICKEYKKIRTHGITEAELQKAKNYLLGKIVLNLEDSEEYAHFLCRQELLKNNIQNISTIKKQLQSVTKEAVENIAQKYLTQKNIHVAVIGPFPQNFNEEIKTILNQ